MVRIPTADQANSRRSPALLALVFGVFLFIIGVTATGQSILVSSHLTTQSLAAVVGDDASLVRILVNSTLVPADLDPATLTSARAAVLQSELAVVVSRGNLLRLDVRTPGGALLFASDAFAASATSSADFATAAAGSTAASIEPATDPRFGTSQILTESLPITSGGTVQAVLTVTRDAEPVLARIGAARQEIVLLTLSAAVVVAVILYLIFRSAHRRLQRQTVALVEAARRDPLTGRLNHGALVGSLASSVEAARAEGGAVEVGLIDIDNFRLLNDTHGHGAGDAALLELSRILSDCAPEGSIVGRYGPDEYLVISKPGVVAALRPAFDQLRSTLTEVSMRYGDSEQLPLTISAGICSFPLDADSVTGLLSIAAMTLGEAKGSGGDAIRVAEAAGATRAFTKSFDILQGLVIAIDTKDRYTKRHSEDVARYADFLADRLGLGAELRQAIHVAGLLHDVGKIGIPDQILRKPAKLTAEEQGAVQQHVALGHMIVRDLPHLELVKAGIRFHHERWDGRGYLDRLEGEQIPLIARLLAVADAFSAMTTTRPYRKGIPVDEALVRLEDSVGTQLDEELVRAFVLGIRTAEDPPLPDMDVWRARIWTPNDRVA
ncbi:MAG: diguanylate cyclase [Chloroflexi bacterium]|nr:diguanylate cyclase [Chloroflexota bacterium]